MALVMMADGGGGGKKTKTNQQLVQDYITANNLAEGDRARWGQALKYGTINGQNALTLYNSLSAEEKAALTGNPVNIKGNTVAVTSSSTPEYEEVTKTDNGAELDAYKKAIEEQKDAQISSINSAYKINKQTAESNYDTALNAISAEYRAVLEALGLTKRTQERGAYVNLQKLLKYLPEYLQRQGLSGLGISASSVIDAYGRYQDALNAIEAENQKTVSEYDRQRLSDTATLEQNKANALASYNLQQLSASQEVTDNYYAALAKLAADEEQRKQQKAAENVELLYNYLGGGSSGDSYTFDDYEGDTGGAASGKVNVVAANAKKSDGLSLFDGYVFGIGQGWKDKTGDKFTASINDKNYTMKMGDALSSSAADDVKAAVGGTVPPNTVLEYNGKLVVSTDSGNLRYVNEDRKEAGKLKKYLAS